MVVCDEEIEDRIESGKTTQTSLPGMACFILAASNRAFKSVGKIEGPTQANIYGLKVSPHAGDALRESSNMSILALEIFGG